MVLNLSLLDCTYCQYPLVPITEAPRMSPRRSFVHFFLFARYLFSHRLFLAAFSIIPVDLSFRFFPRLYLNRVARKECMHVFVQFFLLLSLRCATNDILPQIRGEFSFARFRWASWVERAPWHLCDVTRARSFAFSRDDF